MKDVELNVKTTSTTKRTEGRVVYSAAGSSSTAKNSKVPALNIPPAPKDETRNNRERMFSIKGNVEQLNERAKKYIKLIQPENASDKTKLIKEGVLPDTKSPEKRPKEKTNAPKVSHTAQTRASSPSPTKQTLPSTVDDKIVTAVKPKIQNTIQQLYKNYNKTGLKDESPSSSRVLDTKPTKEKGKEKEKEKEKEKGWSNNYSKSTTSPRKPSLPRNTIDAFVGLVGSPVRSSSPQHTTTTTTTTTQTSPRPQQTKINTNTKISPRANSKTPSPRGSSTTSPKTKTTPSPPRSSATTSPRAQVNPQTSPVKTPSVSNHSTSTSQRSSNVSPNTKSKASSTKIATSSDDSISHPSSSTSQTHSSPRNESAQNSTTQVHQNTTPSTELITPRASETPENTPDLHVSSLNTPSTPETPVVQTSPTNSQPFTTPSVGSQQSATPQNTYLSNPHESSNTSTSSYLPREDWLVNLGATSSHEPHKLFQEFHKTLSHLQLVEESIVQANLLGYLSAAQTHSISKATPLSPSVDINNNNNNNNNNTAVGKPEKVQTTQINKAVEIDNDDDDEEYRALMNALNEKKKLKHSLELEKRKMMLREELKKVENDIQIIRIEITDKSNNNNNNIVTHTHTPTPTPTPAQKSERDSETQTEKPIPSTKHAEVQVQLFVTPTANAEVQTEKFVQITDSQTQTPLVSATYAEIQTDVTRTSNAETQTFTPTSSMETQTTITPTLNSETQTIAALFVNTQTQTLTTTSNIETQTALVIKADVQTQSNENPTSEIAIQTIQTKEEVFNDDSSIFPNDSVVMMPSSLPPHSPSPIHSLTQSPTHSLLPSPTHSPTLSPSHSRVEKEQNPTNPMQTLSPTRVNQIVGSITNDLLAKLFHQMNEEKETNVIPINFTTTTRTASPQQETHAISLSHSPRSPNELDLSVSIVPSLEHLNDESYSDSLPSSILSDSSSILSPDSFEEEEEEDTVTPTSTSTLLPVSNDDATTSHATITQSTTITEETKPAVHLTEQSLPPIMEPSNAKEDTEKVVLSQPIIRKFILDILRDMTWAKISTARKNKTKANSLLPVSLYVNMKKKTEKSEPENQLIYDKAVFDAVVQSVQTLIDNKDNKINYVLEPDLIQHISDQVVSWIKVGATGTGVDNTDALVFGTFREQGFGMAHLAKKIAKEEQQIIERVTEAIWNDCLGDTIKTLNKLEERGIGPMWKKPSSV